jgi:hypothetical protein
VIDPLKFLDQDGFDPSLNVWSKAREDHDVSQDTFHDSQNKKMLHPGGLDARVASFLT